MRNAFAKLDAKFHPSIHLPSTDLVSFPCPTERGILLLKEKGIFCAVLRWFMGGSGIRRIRGLAKSVKRAVFLLNC